MLNDLFKSLIIAGSLCFSIDIFLLYVKKHSNNYSKKYLLGIIILVILIYKITISQGFIPLIIVSIYLVYCYLKFKHKK